MSKISSEDYTATSSAFLYLLAEQQILMGRLLGELSRSGVLNSAALNKITAGRNDIETLTPAYAELYKDYASYFVRVKMALAELDKEELQNEKLPKKG